MYFHSLGARSLSLVDSDYPEAYNLRFHCSGSESLLVDCPKTLITSCDNLLAAINCGGSCMLLEVVIAQLFS